MPKLENYLLRDSNNFIKLFYEYWECIFLKQKIDMTVYIHYRAWCTSHTGEMQGHIVHVLTLNVQGRIIPV